MGTDTGESEIVRVGVGPDRGGKVWTPVDPEVLRARGFGTVSGPLHDTPPASNLHTPDGLTGFGLSPGCLRGRGGPLPG